MSKTAAIREAATYVSISGRGTSWAIHGPWEVRDLRGASTSVTADSYPKAVRIRTAWRARIALALMERLDRESDSEVDCILNEPYARCGHDLHGVVSAAAAEFGTGPTAAEIAEAEAAYREDEARRERCAA